MITLAIDVVGTFELLFIKKQYLNNFALGTFELLQEKIII